MKGLSKTILLFAFILTGISTSIQSTAQAVEIQQLLLNVEKLAQLKQILYDMKKGYTIISTGYNTIKGLSKGNFNLHKIFLDGLMQVSPAVRKYKRVADIVKDQLMLVKEYKSAFHRFKRHGHFNAEELTYIGHVYDNLIRESLENLDNLLMVITAEKLRMSDAERLEAIDRIYADMQEKLQFLRHFNDQTTILALQRDKEQNDAAALKSIYGINK